MEPVISVVDGGLNGSGGRISLLCEVVPAAELTGKSRVR